MRVYQRRSSDPAPSAGARSGPPPPACYGDGHDPHAGLALPTPDPAAPDQPREPARRTCTKLGPDGSSRSPAGVEMAAFQARRPPGRDELASGREDQPQVKVGMKSRASKDITGLGTGRQARHDRPDHHRSDAAGAAPPIVDSGHSGRSRSPRPTSSACPPLQTTRVPPAAMTRFEATSEGVLVAFDPPTRARRASPASRATGRLRARDRRPGRAATPPSRSGEPVAHAPATRCRWRCSRAIRGSLCRRPTQAGRDRRRARGHASRRRRRPPNQTRFDVRAPGRGDRRSPSVGTVTRPITSPTRRSPRNEGGLPRRAQVRESAPLQPRDGHETPRPTRR